MNKFDATVRTVAGLLYFVVAFFFITTNLTSCSDDLAADSYYTFTGEMMSDYLKNREDFSLFAQIVDRAGQMDFLSTRGSRTFFPAVNSGVEALLAELGYSSVDEIPVDYCDTLVKACLVERLLYTYEIQATHQESNELDLPLIIVTDGDSLDQDNMVVSIINKRAAIINDMKNDSVENGVIHPVDRVIVPNTSLGSSLLDENQASFTVFYEALRRCSLLDSLYSYRDDDYESWKENYAEFTSSMRIGNEDYVGKRPDNRYDGFTVFIVPDEVLYTEYSEYFNEGMTMDEKIDALYQIAVDAYSDTESASIFGLNDVVEGDPEGRTYKERYWNKNELTSRYNPLNMFLSYHMLDRLFTSSAKFLNCWGVYTAYLDPTEWINTMLEFSCMKLEKVYRTIDSSVEYPGEFYINHSHASIYNSYERYRGAHITVPSEENFSLNVAFYYVDRFLTYEQPMRANVMNARMRIDFMTLWPELTNNNIRLCGNPTQAYGTYDNNQTGSEAGGFNYYLPPGYLRNATFSENTTFFVQRPIVYWSSLHGDVMGVLGTSYDVTFRLPTVPPGNYELRLGYCALTDRGIGQVYVDGVPQGIPIDMRYGPDDSRVGGLYNGFNGWRNSDENSNGLYSTEELEENARVMKNNGYYSGPKGAFYNNDGTTEPKYSASSCVIHYNQNDLLRRKICNVQIQPHTYHTVRLRSVLSSSDSGNFVLDYMELVPISISGAGGVGEDLY